MKSKRLMLGVLALLLLLALLWWRFLPAKIAPASPGAAALPAQHPVVVVEVAQPAMAATVEMPKLPPVKASGAPPTPLSVNDWGELEFTDGVPMVRTMATGETCIIIPTVITPNPFDPTPFDDSSNVGSVHFDMLVEAPGFNPLLSRAAIEALRGQDVKDFLNAEFVGARDGLGKIESNPSITAAPGQEAEIAIGSPETPVYFSIRFKPKINTGKN